MMRRIVMRHEGQLPLSSVEHIWREIITVFTAMQAPFSVVAGPADDCAAHRDVIRFYFGFSIEIEQAETAEAALEMIGESTSKIAVLALRGDTPWWQALEPEAGIKIFAKFPFLLADGRVELPTVYVAGPPVRDLAQPDVCLFSLTAEPGGSLEMLAGIDAVTAISCGNDHLLEVAGEITDTELHEVLGGAGIDAGRLSRVGGFARPIELL